MSEPSEKGPAEKRPACPICRRPLSSAKDAAKFAPFCSRRCADLDLGRWLKGGYAIPGADAETPAQGPAQVPDDE
jgi:endogenous inhibitor of DNA gyrase (YacG/DUF329 family)